MGASPPKFEVNGMKIPLIIDTGIIISVIVIGTVMYTELQQLKEDRSTRVSGERIAVVEERVTYNSTEIRRLEEENRKDSERLWQAIERMNNSGRR